MAQKKLSPKKCSSNVTLYIRNVPEQYVDRFKSIAKENGMTFAGTIMLLVKELDAKANDSHVG